MEDTKSKKSREYRLGNLYGATGGNYAGNVYSQDFLSPTINTCGGGGREPHIVIIQKLSKGDSNDSKKSTGWETDK